MPCPVLIGSESVAGQSQFLKDIRAGKYEGFFLKLSGDALAAQTLTAAGFGRIKLLAAGTEVVTVDYDNQRVINQIWGGEMRIVAVAGANHQFPVYIPRGWKDDNVHQVNAQDQVQVQIDYGATFTTVFTGADVAIQRVYGLWRDTGRQAYNLRIKQINKVYGAGVFLEDLNTENVLGVYVVAVADSLDRVRVVKDGIECLNAHIGDTGTVVAADEDWLEISDNLNKVYAATDAVATATTSAIAEADIAKPGQIGEFLSDDIQVEFVTSPAATYTQEMIVYHADFTDSKLQQTKAEEAAIVQRKISKKVQFGRTRPVRTLEELGRS